MDILTRILCKECRWDGYVSETRRMDTIVVPGHSSFLCPRCRLPLARRETLDGDIEMIRKNAADMSRAD